MKKITLLILLLSSFNILSQNIHKIDSAYISYFENTREIPYLHLNKTSFLKGEEIWFQAYVKEQNSGKLHPATSNLYVSIFNESGEMKDQHLIHIKNGIGKGNIYIDSTFKEETYFIKASTNWMKNFNEDNSYIQKVKIISPLKKGKKIIEEKEFYEFKIFPEGGHVLESSINNLGILIKDKFGKGVKINKGVIKNKSDEIIHSFKTNLFGLGNISFFFDKNEIYEFEAILENGTTIKTTPPRAKKKGLTIRVVNSDPHSLSITLNTNKNSIKDLNNSSYKILIHNTSEFRSYNFNINKVDTKYSLLLNKENLPYGINIITVFKGDNTPILERLIFINNSSLFSELKVERKSLSIDSLEIKLSNLTNQETYMSASFLPITTKTYNPKNNIISKFILKPFIKGDIENASYYFKNINSKKLRELDLLLITQGWSKHKWYNIFNTPSKTSFKFENGIDITIKINKKIKKKQSILMYSPKNEIIREIRPKQSSYILENTYIKKNSNIKFGLKSNGDILKTTPVLSYSNGSLYESLKKTHITENTKLEDSIPYHLSSDFEVLDEIEIKTNKRKYKNQPYGATTMLRGVRMADIIMSSGRTVIEFLKFKGFNINLDNLDYKEAKEKPESINEDKNIDKLDAKFSSTSSLYKPKITEVYLNNINVTRTPWILEGMYLDRIKEIFYGKDPRTSAEKTVYIYSLSSTEYNSKKAQFSNVKTPYGFSNEKEYYNPKYPSYSNKTYQHFGAVYWKSNIKIPANSSVSFKIPKNQQNKLKMFVEGISQKGKLISKEIILK